MSLATHTHRATPQRGYTPAPQQGAARKRAPLGTTETTLRADGEHGLTAEEYTRRLWQRQRVMWEVTDDKRLAGCHRWRAGGVSPSVVWTPSGASYVGGLQDSHSAWASPVSAAGIAKRRMSEVEQATREHYSTGGGAVLAVTLTMSHSREHELAALIDVLTSAFAVTFNANKSWLKRYKCQKWTRFIEITHGWNNGWHPHIHALVWIPAPLSDDALADMQAAVLVAWQRAVMAKADKHGVTMPAPSFERGVLVDQFTDLETSVVAARYAAKGGEAWTPAAEVAGGAFKEAKNGNMTQWQLLDALATAKGAERRRLVAVWREFEAATKGRRQMSWSKVAREELNVEIVPDEEVDTDLELADVAEVATTRYAVGAFEQWGDLSDDVDTRRQICGYVARATSPEQASYRARVICETLGVALRPMCSPVVDGHLTLADSARTSPTLAADAHAVAAL